MSARKTTELVIAEFLKVHGDRYDYSIVDYKNNSTKVTIICPDHGEFDQRPSHHKNGVGCPICRNKMQGDYKRLSGREVIDMFKKTHGDKYDYSKVDYKNNQTKVTIICHEHGEFQQVPMNHKKGVGCPKCYGNLLGTTEQVIEEFRKVHRDRYNYSKINYKNSQTKVTIICNEHGEFQQTPNSHKRGSGCPQCGTKIRGAKLGLSNKVIIEQFKEVHGERYDYSKVDYKTNHKKVTIICPYHGEFDQRPSHHKNGVGCPDCSGNVPLTTEKIVKQFKKVHGERYKYSKVVYKGSDTKIKIICYTHGVFYQTPYNHRNGNGCPTCNRGWTKSKIIEFINSIENHDLLNMDDIELQTIINQGKLPDAFNQFVFGDGDRADTIRSLKEKFESELSDGDDEVILDVPELVELDEYAEDDIDEGDLSFTGENIPKPDKQGGHLSILTLSENYDDLHVLDNAIVSSCDEEAIEFLIRYKLRKLWNKVLNNDISTDQFRKEKGGNNFNTIKGYFFNEFDEVNKYSPPLEYNFRDKDSGEILSPNLMQKLTVYRLMKNKRYGNWSGTGAGKTISFILGSREIDARLSILVGLNSTIKQLKEDIEDVFPDSRVLTRYNKGHVFDRKYNNYLVLNYDKFQQGYSEGLLQDLTDQNHIDFIAIDEIHNVKQRSDNKESQRRGSLKRLIGRAAEKNKGLYVLGMSATPVINNLTEARSLLEMVTGKEYDDLNTKKTLRNAIEVFKHLTLNGLRYRPKYDIELKELTADNTPGLKIDGTPLLNDLLKIENHNYLKAEQLILKEKLKFIKPYLGKGILIYSYFTTGMIDVISAYLLGSGYKVGTFTGAESTDEREDNKNKFISGEIDILIGSRPVGTGVDGLQKVCNRMIVLSLPWTDSEYTQLKGRIYRQGSKFGDVEIVIPQVYINMDDGEWSWDRQRINLIKNKKTLADAAIDGVIPSKKIPSPKTLFAKSQEALKDWRDRLNEGKIIKIDRQDLSFPLRPEIVEQLGRRLGDFSEINRSWSVANSGNTHEKLKSNPADWYYYHTLYSEKREEWDEVPYVEIGKMITRPEFIVADLGCGENLLSKEIPNKVLAFDHVAIDENVTACDISNLPIKDAIVDVTVLSLSLMGSNYQEYIKEAHRVLKSMGVIIIAEPATKWKGKENDLEDILVGIGFNKPTIKYTMRFMYVTSVKF